MKLKSKISVFLDRHRFFFFFFLYVVLYNVIIVNRLRPWSLTSVTESVYHIDYSFGFASKLLPGAVFNLFFGANASTRTVTAYTTVVMFIFFFGLAVLLERFIRRVESEYVCSALVLIVFLLSGAYTFAIYTKWLGLLDTAWLLLTLLFFVCIDNKVLRFFIPVIYVLSLLIHFSALVFVLTLFSILLLYRASIAESKNDKRIYIAIFLISLIITILLFFYLILNESDNVVPIDEFHAKLESRGFNYFTYIDYSFFNIVNGKEIVPDSINAIEPAFLKFLNRFCYQIKANYGLLNSDGILAFVCGVAVLAPVVCFITAFHFRRLKQVGSSLKRFCMFLFIVQFPFVFIMGILFAISADMTRYLTHAFLGMLVCLCVVLYYEQDLRSDFFETMRLYKNNLPAKLYFLIYILTSFAPSV